MLFFDALSAISTQQNWDNFYFVRIHYGVVTSAQGPINTVVFIHYMFFCLFLGERNRVMAV